jgi:hypothetical protein
MTKVIGGKKMKRIKQGIYRDENGRMIYTNVMNLLEYVKNESEYPEIEKQNNELSISNND